MKPSQFKRIERSAIKQRGELKQAISRAETIGDGIAQHRNSESLKNLISTMRSLNVLKVPRIG